jgi:hypothetical protein
MEEPGSPEWYQTHIFSHSGSRTPLHCAASCNSVHLCKQLVESGAAIFASTISDIETAADKCEEMEEGYIQCSQFLYGMQGGLVCLSFHGQATPYIMVVTHGPPQCSMQVLTALTLQMRLKIHAFGS